MDDDVLGCRRKLLLLVRLMTSNKVYHEIDKTSLEFEKPVAVRASPTMHFRFLLLAGVGRDISVGIWDSLRVGRSVDRIPVGGEIFRTRPHQHWDPPSHSYDGYRVFPAGKTAGAWR